MLWEDSKSLYSAIPWLPRHVGLPLVSGVFFVINLVAIIWMSIKGYYHLDFYTYWNFIIVTVFLGGNLVFYPIGGWTSALFTAGWGPVTLGSTANVAILILIIVAIDDRVYVSGTAADALTLVPQYSFSQIRTGDWLIHGLPWLEAIILMLFDYQIYCRALLYHWERSAPWYRRIGYWAYFYVAPLIPMTIYMAIFDPTKKYTDKLTRAEGILLLLGINFVVMTVYALSLRLSEHRGVELPDFYADYLHAPPTKSARISVHRVSGAVSR